MPLDSGATSPGVYEIRGHHWVPVSESNESDDSQELLGPLLRLFHDAVERIALGTPPLPKGEVQLNLRQHLLYFQRGVSCGPFREILAFAEDRFQHLRRILTLHEPGNPRQVGRQPSHLHRWRILLVAAPQCGQVLHEALRSNFLITCSTRLRISLSWMSIARFSFGRILIMAPNLISSESGAQSAPHTSRLELPASTRAASQST